MIDSPFYDALETRSAEEREAALLAALRVQLARAKARAPAFAAILADVDPAEIVDRRTLVLLPVTRKSALIEHQRSAPPFGGFAALAPGDLARIFSSPGPIYDPEGRREDYWRMARALYAAGFRVGDIVHNCFSYHLTPAGSMLESGAHALGCAVIPGGTGQSEQQVRTIADLKPAGYVGTPSFLAIVLDKAAELGTDLACLTRALVSGPAGVGGLQKPQREPTPPRLVVPRDARGGDEMTLKVERGEPAEEVGRIAATLQALPKLRGTVTRVPQGSLPNDGKVIDDIRPPD